MPWYFRRRNRPPSAVAPIPSPGPGTPPEDPVLAHAWFCAHLPLLRAEADRHGWRPELEAQVTAIREGQPATEALDALLLTRQGTVRGTEEVPLQGLWDQAPIVQRFHCPRAVCPPRGRARDATEPWCNLDDQPLHPTTHRLDQ